MFDYKVYNVNLLNSFLKISNDLKNLQILSLRILFTIFSEDICCEICSKHCCLTCADSELPDNAYCTNKNVFNTSSESYRHMSKTITEKFGGSRIKLDVVNDYIYCGPQLSASDGINVNF